MQTRDFLQEWQDRSAASLQSTRTTGTANKPLPHSAEVSTTQSPAHPSLLRVRTLSLHISKWTSIRPFTATHLACTAASADTGHSLVSPPRITPTEPSASPVVHPPGQLVSIPSPFCSNHTPCSYNSAASFLSPATLHGRAPEVPLTVYSHSLVLAHYICWTGGSRPPPPPFHCLAAMWNNGAPTHRRPFHPLQVRCGWPPEPPCGRPSAARGCQSWRP